MKKYQLFFAVIIITMIQSCGIENNTPDSYSSIEDFFVKNGVPMQTFTISAQTGGNFTTPQGTIVTIPSNAFKTQGGTTVSGNVTIHFKDIYKKSDMLLSDMPTTSYSGAPLKSGGEFFIKATQNTSTLILQPGKKIDIQQPVALTGGLDTMQAFIRGKDSLNWNPAPTDSIYYAANNYVFSLYQFHSPVESGSWCNSDNSSYFSAYPNTLLTLQPFNSIAEYNTQVFLVFRNISSMVHVYEHGTKFPYYYAPQGLQCTLVAIGVKNGKLYSSFVPITITSNLTVNFSLDETTTNEFKNALEALN